MQYNEQKQNKVRPGYGANNVGVIIEDVTNGDILAMASYPNYDLSNPYDLSRIVGMPKLDDNDNPTDEYMTQEDVDALDTYEQQSRYLNALWSNFCISTPYEPGSTAKPFTYAAGLESGKMTGDETYYCGGYLNVGGWDIYCHNRNGDGILTDNEAIERSCNVALMQMAEQIGVSDFTKFQRIFGFGLRTNIDLAGEARTDSMVISPDNMSISDLATNSFGQNFDVTMIQMISAFSSLINGGYYWQPHVVSRITSASGATIQNIEPPRRSARRPYRSLRGQTEPERRQDLPATASAARPVPQRPSPEETMSTSSPLRPMPPMRTRRLQSTSSSTE